MAGNVGNRRFEVFSKAELQRGIEPKLQFCVVSNGVEIVSKFYDDHRIAQAIADSFEPTFAAKPLDVWEFSEPKTKKLETKIADRPKPKPKPKRTPKPKPKPKPKTIRRQYPKNFPLTRRKR